MPAPVFSSFCPLELSGIAWPLKSQTRSSLMNMNIVICSTMLPMRRPFLLVPGRIFRLDAEVVWRTSLQAALPSWILAGVASPKQQTWSSFLGFFERHRCSSKGPALFHKLSDALCSFSDCKTYQSIEGYFFSVSPNNPPYGFTRGTTLLWSNASINTLLQRAEEGMENA